VYRTMEWIGEIRQTSREESIILRRKGKAIPLQACTSPWGSGRLRLPELSDIRHRKVVGMSTLRSTNTGGRFC